MAINPSFGATAIVDAFTGWTLQNTENADQVDEAASQAANGDNLASAVFNDRNEVTCNYVANTASPTIPNVGQVTTTGTYLLTGVQCAGSHNGYATMQANFIKWDDNSPAAADNVFTPSLTTAQFPCGAGGFGLSGSAIGLAAWTAGGDVHSISYQMGVTVHTAENATGDHLAVEIVNAREEVTENWVGEVNITGLTAGWTILSKSDTTSNAEHNTCTIQARKFTARN